MSEAGLLEKKTGLEFTFLTRFRGYAFCDLTRCIMFQQSCQKWRSKDRQSIVQHDWRKQRDEFGLHAFLLMHEKKRQLLKHLICADGRDIYSTLKFDKEEKDRTLNEVLDDIDD